MASEPKGTSVKVIREWGIDSQPPNEAWAEKRRLAAAMRNVIENLVTSDAPADELARAANGLERYAESLTRHPRHYGRMKFVDVIGGEKSFRGVSNELNPIIGQSNPLAPPLDMWIEDQAACGRVKFGWAYEGPPGCVHGGYVAAIFDQFLGFAQTMTEMPGVTGTLEVRYIKPTPVNAELTLRGRVLSVEGRKIFTEGAMHAGDVLTASCKALFIRIPGERYRAMADQQFE